MNNINAKFLNEARELEGRWQETGLLNGIKDKYTRSCAAVLLENQRLINEISTDTGDIAQFKRISIPLVRRIYPQLIANKVVSVQPLLGPTGLVYYLRFRMSSDKGATRGGTVNGGFPADDQYTLMQRASGDANLDIWYSSQVVSQETTSVDAGANSTITFAPLEKTPILPGTMTGTIYVGGVATQNFVVPQTGNWQFTTLGATTVSFAARTEDELKTMLELNDQVIHEQEKTADPTPLCIANCATPP
jgi:hypothetical protein